MNTIRFDNLFKKHPNINQDYFQAAIPPWEIEEKEAIRLYVEYVKNLILEDPDTDQSIERLSAGFKFVFRFCKKNGLTFEQYLLQSEDVLPCWVSHLKNHKIDYHLLHSLKMSMPIIDSELLGFVIPNFFANYQRTKQKFYSSKRMKEFATKAKEQLESRLS